MATRIIAADKYELDTAGHGNLMAWAKANGLDPNLIPLQSEFVIEDGAITYEVVVLDDNGRSRVDPQDEERTLRETQTAPLLSSLEEHGL